MSSMGFGLEDVYCSCFALSHALLVDVMIAGRRHRSD